VRKLTLVALSLLIFAFLTSCGGSMGGAPTTTASGGVPVSLTIGDDPPSGVAILFFEALITEATLQPSDMTKPAVSVLATPTEVEFGHLQTDTAFLSLTSVPPDTYTSLTLDFGNAVLTVVNHSGKTVGGCTDGSVCQLSPSFSPMSATISSAPFPVMITQNSVVGIRLDFDVNSSVQPDLSINPTVTLKRLTQRQDSDEEEEMENIDEVDGQVTSVGTSQFTLMNERSGQMLTIMVDTNTMFEDFDRSGCATIPANIMCVQTGQILDVDLAENGMGTMLAKRVEFEEGANRQALKGTITSVDSTTQFHMVVFNEEPIVPGVSEGSVVDVMIAPNAVFQVGREEMGEDGGFSFAGLTFAGGSDLLVGQDVQIRPSMPSSDGGVTTVTTDLVRLWPSQITGQVSSSPPSMGAFALTNLSPLFTGATPPVTTIDVVTLSDMEFKDFSGLDSVTPGSTITVKGLLFNTSGTPTLVTRTLREEGDD